MIAYLTLPKLPWPQLFRDQPFTKYLTKFMIIVSFMEVGLKIDRPF